MGELSFVAPYGEKFNFEFDWVNRKTKQSGVVCGNVAYDNFNKKRINRCEASVLPIFISIDVETLLSFHGKFKMMMDDRLKYGTKLFDCL